MILQKISMCLSFRDLLLIATKESFSSVNPEDIAEVLTDFSAGLSFATNHSNENHHISSSQNDMKIRGRRFEPALLRIWELARNESRTDIVRRKKWKSVMATCNALYEQLDFSLNQSSQTTPIKRAA